MQNPDVKDGSKRVLFSTFAVTCVYALFRAWVFYKVPVFDSHGMFDFNLWFRRDIWMSIPRLLAWGACLALMRRSGSWSTWGWHPNISLISLMLLMMCSIGFVLGFLKWGVMSVFSGEQMIIGWLTTLPMVLFEQTCFLGLVFTSLRRIWNPRLAAFLSSLFLTAFHFQAYPLQGLPALFLLGFVMCAAFFRGAGLPWLIFFHEVLHSLYFHTGTDVALPRLYPWLDSLGFGVCVGAAFWSYFLLRESRQKFPAIPPPGVGERRRWGHWVLLFLLTGFFLIKPGQAAGVPEMSEGIYLTFEEALKLAFPQADHVRTDDHRLTLEERARVEEKLAWRLPEESFRFYIGEKARVVQGYAVVLNEIGKARPITFMVKVDPDGRVGDVLVMAYRESIGSEVKGPAFLKQFRGKSGADRLRVGREIRNITGASLSCRAIAAGVKKAAVLVKELYIKAG